MSMVIAQFRDLEHPNFYHSAADPVWIWTIAATAPLQGRDPGGGDELSHAQKGSWRFHGYPLEKRWLAHDSKLCVYMYIYIYILCMYVYM